MAARGKRLRSKEVLPLLDQLVDKNLVVTDNTPEQRYRLSETVREYLREAYGHSAESAACRIRHRKYFTTLATEMEPKMLSDETKEATDLLFREHDNLRMAIDNALHEDPVDALHLTGALWRFWSRRGFYAEGRTRALEALEKTADLGDTIDRAKALHSLGSLAWTLGELKEAEDSIKRALAIFQTQGDPYHAAGCLIKLGNIVLDRSDFSGARNYYEQCLAIYRELDDLNRIGATLNNLGILSMLFGDYEEALELWNEAIDYAARSGVANTALYARNNISELYLSRCEYDKANVLSQDVLKSAEELGEEHIAAGAFNLLGQIAHAKGDLNDARTLLSVSVQRSEAMGDLLIASESWRFLSLANFELGELAIAIDQMRRAMSGYRKLMGNFEISKALSFAGIVLSDPRLWATAERLLGEMGIVLTPHERRILQPAMDRVRASMGNEEFETAWREGERLSVDEAVHLVLGQ